MKFGTRDQVQPTGALVRPPKSLKTPPLKDSWFKDLSVSADEKAAFAETHASGTYEKEDEAAAKITEYKASSKRYAKARAEYLVARKELNSKFNWGEHWSGEEGLTVLEGFGADFLSENMMHSLYFVCAKSFTDF